MIARDASYYKMALPSQDLSYHDFRNWDINSYIGGLEALADEGPIVVRMGVVVDQALKSLHPRVIDYATSGYQSRFGDGWLGANFKFCISEGLGFYAIPAAFRRPNAFVNFSPVHMFDSSRKVDLGITKMFERSDTRDMISFAELEGPDISSLTRSERLRSAGLGLRDNTVNHGSRSYL